MIEIMPKTNPKELNFPSWSETSKYGINTLPLGETVKLHFHDANQFWIVIQGRGTATSEGITYELGPGDMLMTKAGSEHSLFVTEEMVVVFFYGVMPPGGRFGYLYRGIDPEFAEWRKQSESTLPSIEQRGRTRASTGAKAFETRST
jgi:mannose-6-phosphate isomerase-like protein (cupin superfamily)